MIRSFISLRAGVQSTALCLLAAKGVIKTKPIAAIFADTQSEPKEVYTHLEWMRRPGFLPFPIIVATKGSLAEASLVVRRSKKSGRLYQKTLIPAFVFKKGEKNPPPLRRQCTATYKIEVVQREARKLLGMNRIPKDSGVLIKCMIGISTDEAHRMKPSQVHWIENVYPLIDLGMSRQDCLDWVKKNRFPRPPRSACVFCPYHSDAEWLRLKSEHPGEFKKAVEYEERFRKAARRSEALDADGLFLHRSCVPLSKVGFKKGENEGQFGNECEGMCGN